MGYCFDCHLLVVNYLNVFKTYGYMEIHTEEFQKMIQTGNYRKAMEFIDEKTEEFAAKTPRHAMFGEELREFSERASLWRESVYDAYCAVISRINKENFYAKVWDGEVTDREHESYVEKGQIVGEAMQKAIQYTGTKERGIVQNAARSAYSGIIGQYLTEAQVAKSRLEGLDGDKREAAVSRLEAVRSKLVSYVQKTNSTFNAVGFEQEYRSTILPQLKELFILTESARA
jgi:hypothetical protein